MTLQEQLAHTAQLAEDAKAKSAAKQAAKDQAAKEASTSKQYTAEEIAARVQVVQAWEDWSKSKPSYAGLKQTEHNFNVLGEALLPIQNLSIAAIDEAVHRLTREGRLEYVQGPAVEKIVYRDKPKTQQQTRKEHEDELMKFGPRKVRDSFDRVQDAEDRAKKEASTPSQEEMDFRSLQHYTKEAAQIASIIDHYSYPRSPLVETHRKNLLRQVVARDEDGYRNLIVELKLVNQLLDSFSTEPGRQHDSAVKNAQKALAGTRPQTVRGW